MAFQTVPINITGPSYQDRSRPLSVQETRNFYPEIVESGKDQFVIKSFPGQKLLGSTTAGIDRGMHQMNEIAYRVVGDSLYKVLSDGVHTSKGEIIGYERCTFADDGVNLFINSHGRTYHYDSSADSLSIVADTSIIGALSVTFINNQFAYTFPLLTVFSDVGNGASASSLNAVGAESDPDELLRDYAFDQVLYRFGKRSIENWYNSGVGTPPFDRIEGQIINVGLAATHSVNNTKEFIYWLGSDLNVYRARGGQDQVVSTAAISGAIGDYSFVGDAFGEVFTLDNKDVYVLTFPTANKTWALIEELGKDGWFELSDGVSTDQYKIGSLFDMYGETLVGHKSNGELYTLDFDTFTQNGNTWQRRRTLTSINGKVFNQPGKRVQMSRMEFIFESGTGLSTGQGDNPRIMIEASYDGGRSWSTGTWIRVGRLGEFNVRAEWFSMKSFYDMIIRITASDPVAINLYSATIDLRLAGR